MKRWMEIDGLGRIEVEIELVTFDIPLLFVCQDGERNRYLVLCIDEELGEYLAVKCTSEKLLAMLNNEIPMDNPFVEAQANELFLFRYDFEKKRFGASIICSEELTRDMLPDANAYFELKNDKIRKYIETLHDEGSIIIRYRVKRKISEFESSNNFIYESDREIDDLADGKKISLVWIRRSSDGFESEIENSEDSALKSLTTYVIERSVDYAI